MKRGPNSRRSKWSHAGPESTAPLRVILLSPIFVVGLALVVVCNTWADSIRLPTPGHGAKSATSISIVVFGAVEKSGIYYVQPGAQLGQLLEQARLSKQFAGRCGLRRLSGERWMTTYFDLTEGAVIVLKDGDHVHALRNFHR
jgi:hypothetical protein